MQERQKILVVDDTSEHFRILDNATEDDNLKIIKASSGQQALSMVREYDFSLIVINAHMPEMDGFVTAELIRRDEKKGLIPIIFAVTPDDHGKYVCKSIDGGPVDYIFNPIDPQLLKGKIKTFLQLDHFKKKVALTCQHLDKILAEQTEMKADVNAAFDKIKALTEKLNEKQTEVKEMAEQNKAVQKEKYNFINTISHESRTYMNGIIGMSGLLLDTSLDDEQRDYAQTTCDSAQSLLNIINDIVILSKIETNELDLEMMSFDLLSEVNQVFKVIKLLAEEKGLEFVKEVDPNLSSRFRGDPERIKQILMNLTENAVKFTNEGRVNVTLRLKKDNPETSVIYFEIRDTGMGIPNHKLKSLFENLSREGNLLSNKYGRSKLGLSISKILIELMGGEIGAESILDEGSIFWFTLSLEKQQDKISRDKKGAVQKLKQKRILVIENHVTFQRLLTEYLSSLECPFKIKADEKSAFRELLDAHHQNQPYEVAIFSTLSPGLNAEEIGYKIKHHENLRDMKLIMLGSSGKESDAQRLLDKGFSAYLSAPIRKNDLINTLIQIGENIDPIAKEAMVQMKANTAPLKKGKERIHRILIAEDNQISQKFIKNLLDKMGYANDVVENGNKVLEALQKPIYNLVLMDLIMPELDGYDTTRAIRDSATPVANHQIPIIALTASALPEERHRCLHMGMDDYISKPIDPEKLFEKLEYWLAKRLNLNYPR